MKHIRQVLRPLVFGVFAVALTGVLLHGVGAKPKSKSAPVAKVASAPAGREVATVAAGCFWSMEAIYQHLEGVDKVEPGYAGGKVKNPSYEQVGSGKTGHAEAVNIIFDPKVISYGDLIKVLLTMRDPTTLNKQGPDEGPNYRSAIFARDAEQAKVARETIRKISAARIWKAPIVTPVEPFRNFYRAENYHLNYYNLHSDEQYSKYVIAPKLADLRVKFPDKVKSK